MAHGFVISMYHNNCWATNGIVFLSQENAKEYIKGIDPHSKMETKIEPIVVLK